MEDSFEHIIKDKLINHPDFDFNEKSWIVAKSRLDNERKLRKYGIYAFIVAMILATFATLIGKVLYDNRVKELKNKIEILNNKNNQTSLILTDTIYKDKIVFIHDTLYKTIYTEQNSHDLQDISNLSLGIFSQNQIAFNTVLLRGIGTLNKLSHIGFTELGLYRSLQNNSILQMNKLSSSNSDLIDDISSLDENRFSKNVLKLPIRFQLINHDLKNRITRDYSYTKWLNDLTRKVVDDKKTLTYKFSKFLTGFKVYGYEVEPLAGSMVSFALNKTEFSFFTGLDTKVLSQNGLKFTAGLRWINYKGEFKAKDIKVNDFPPLPDNVDIFDGIYVSESFWLLPVGIEYQFNHKRKLRPFLGLGWEMRFGILNSYKYEYHDIKTYDEYIIAKDFERAAEFRIYWFKTGLNYDYNYHIGSSVEASYHIGLTNYTYNHDRIKALSFTFNTHYRF